jgi:transcriptional adapter 2-alpha
MNRQYSKDGLLKQYQQEATDNRNRKNNEKQTRLIEERQALENLNRALEQEKRQEQYVKMQRQNEYMEEYSKVLNKKQEERGRLKNKNDYSGTFKIGGESREIRKRNYEEVTNSLPMNPTRHETEYSHGNRYHEERHTNNSINQRGKSHGYNIINHYEEKSPVQNIPHYNNNNQGRNENQTNNRISKLEQQENKYENYHSPDDHHTYGNYINAQPKMEKDNLAHQQDHVPQENNEYDEAEFEKYYENYIKHRMNDVNQGENPHDPSKHNLAEEKPHLNEMNIPSIEKIQEAPQNLEYQQNVF